MTIPATHALLNQRTLFDDLEIIEVEEPHQPSPHQSPRRERQAPDLQFDPKFKVCVTRSKRRKKSSEAVLVGAELRVRIPNHMTRAEEAEIVDYFVEKFEKKYGASRIDLPERAAKLATRYGLETPSSIKWVSNQKQRWGSCSPDERTIRLSDSLIPYPDWVIDYVIVHELAHLTIPAHNDEFWELVNQYAKTERARGYLIAMAHQDQA